MFCVNFQSILETKIFQQSKHVRKDLFQSDFQLPILYLEKNKIHSLSEVVSNDLELITSTHHQNNSIENITPESVETKPKSKSMYDYAFRPSHLFAKKIIPLWNKQYTTNISFLNDTQKVIKNMDVYSKSICSPPSSSPVPYTLNCDKIMEIWKETKESPLFLEKYSYIEWDYLKDFNHSTTFLQTLSVLNMTAPVISFIIPILFLIFPFIILKIQGIPITFSVYYEVLKSIAQNHIIGKTLHSLHSLSWDKVVYILISFAFYFLQIYQNVVHCSRFYRNISTINDYLIELKEYLKYSISSMENFCQINAEITTYRPFCEKTKLHCQTLHEFSTLLEPIQPFTPGFSKIGEIGYLLKCFYQLHSNTEYEHSLCYSVAFEGFIDNLKGIHENIISEKIAYATFDDTKSCEFKEQYYPALLEDDNVVKNNCDLSKNIIITGPNASGKTTLLKTTTINIIFSQQFGCGFYQSSSIHPYTHIHSYLNIPDTSGRDSLFQAESRRCKEIIDAIGEQKQENTSISTSKYSLVEKERHFCIFDELYSGTNPTEATKSAYAFLLYLSSYANVDFILTTHYVTICKKLKKNNRIMNYKMDVIENIETGNVEYTYQMKKGISKVQGAILILKEMNYPKEIIDTIRKYQ